MDQIDHIIDFLCGLPNTIRNDVIIFVLIYAFDYEPQALGDLSSILKERINSYYGMRRFGALLRVIAATDHVLLRFVATENLNRSRLPIVAQMLADNPKLSQYLETRKLALPLELRHAEAALQSWKLLRDNELSPQNLMVIEDKCLKGPGPS
jgi:hypothetical protein